MTFDVTKVGGRVLQHGDKNSPSVTWFGWIPEQKPPEVFKQHFPREHGIAEKAKTSLPQFQLDKSWKDNRDRSNNYLIQEKVSKEFGLKETLQIIQLSGCCVGASGGHSWFMTNCTEIALGGEYWEDLIIPFFLLPYGKSRQECGLDGPGEGSLVSFYGRVIARDGILDAREAGLPQYTETSDGISWKKSDEMRWSNGRVIPVGWLERSRKHLVSNVATITTMDQALAALDNGYGIHHGSSWGGKMQCPIVSDPPVLLNTYSEVWLHAMLTSDYWFHKKLGLLFWIRNTWGRKVHGTCPSGMPRGGFWLRADEWERHILKQGECRAYSDQKGFQVRYNQLAKAA